MIRKEFLKAALLAGLAAGLAAAAFHSFLTEPVIEEAIGIEEELEHPGPAPAPPPVVSRPAQRAGLVLGFLLFGGAWGLLFGAAAGALKRRFPDWSEAEFGLLLAVVSGWTVSLFPFIKYPANPPGVGEPETIAYRQGLYLAVVALSLAGTVLAFYYHRFVAARGRVPWLVWGLYVLYLITVYWALPPDPDPNPMPVELVSKFRAMSFTGLVVFWGILGAVFAWLCREEGD